MKQKNRKAGSLVWLLSTALLLAGSTAIAVTNGMTENKVFKVSSKIMIDGKLISSPVMIAKENQKAFIVLTNRDNRQLENLRIGIIAKNATKFKSKHAIEISYDVQYKNGQEKLHAKPHVIVEPNQESKIRLSSDSTHRYEMDILAERVPS